jgi:hypothetical protein
MFPPRSLEVLRAEVAKVGRYLDTVDYIRLGGHLPGLIEELSGVFHASAGRDREVSAELLMYLFVAAKSMAYRLGYVDLVTVAVERATWAAMETGLAELMAFVAEERCQVFFATGAYNSGMKFVGNALDEYVPEIIGSRSGLAIAGSLHLRSAIMAARCPKQRGTAWDHLAHAGDYAQRIGADTNDYGLIFGPTNVKIHEVATAIELDDPDEALRRAEGFAPPPDLPAERSSHHYIDLARAQFLAGQRDSSFRSLQTADKLAPQHTRNHPMARETMTALIRAHRMLPEPMRLMARKMGVTQ